MGLFDKDPKYQELKKIRDSGYKGWLDQDNKKVSDADVKKWAAGKQKPKGK